MKKDGPLVIEVPPGVMGPLDDAYFRFVVDFGATGPDKGGNYLLLPSGYDGPVPKGSMNRSRHTTTRAGSPTTSNG